jgi:hypothetical protein
MSALGLGRSLIPGVIVKLSIVISIIACIGAAAITVREFLRLL